MSNYYDAFISYGRKESKAFAAKLYQQLSLSGFTAWFDQNDIPLGVDFQNQIDDGIEKSHNFIFIIAPHALRSPYCRKEIELAVRLNKRIIPILHAEPQDAATWEMMHPTISKINWVYCRERFSPDLPQESWEGIDDFISNFSRLVELLGKHREYVEAHTDLLVKALAWERKHYPTQMLLLGEERVLGQRWVLTEFRDEQAPVVPTDLHCHFISQSKQFAENNQTDIFLCNHPDDQPLAEWFQRAFQRKAITIWDEKNDVPTGMTTEQARRDALVGSSHLLFVLSPKSCLHQPSLDILEMALGYNKSIVVVRAKGELPEVPKSLASIRQIAAGDDLEDAFGRAYRQVLADFEHFHLHKIILEQATQWSAFGRPRSMLFRGSNLQAAVAWYHMSRRRSENGPVFIQENFIMESRKLGQQLTTEVFITCSRYDADFGLRLNSGLQHNGVVTWLAKQNIQSAEKDFDTAEQIQVAENLVFVLSRHSVASEYCMKEFLQARSLHKRVLLAQIGPLDGELPREMRGYPMLDFRQRRTDLDGSIRLLLAQLQEHREYVRIHNRLLKKALDWQAAEKNTAHLLVGQARVRAEAWLGKASEALPAFMQPSDLQCLFVCESKKNADDHMTQTFLSYAIEDLDTVEMVQRQLTRRGITSADNTNVRTGITFHSSIMKSIEHADLFIFFVSKASAKTDYCVEEVSHAMLFDKKVILVELEPTPAEELLEELQGLKGINFHDDSKSMAERMKVLLAAIEEDKDYFYQHKLLLAQGFKWKRQRSNPSLLLRGFALQKAEVWIKMGQARDKHRPTPLQEQLVAQSRGLATETPSEVFLAFADKDHDFARKINDLLQSHGKTTWFDHANIPAGANYAAELSLGVEHSENFLLIASKDAYEDKDCMACLSEAERLNKRLIVMQFGNVSPAESPESIRELDWIDFRLEGKHFQTAFSDLLRSIDSDRDHVRGHNRISLKAQEWKSYEKSEDQLLRGIELELAMHWLAQALDKDKTPKPSPLQVEYIQASADFKKKEEDAQALKLEKERDRLAKQKRILADYAREIRRLQLIIEQQREEIESLKNSMTPAR